MNEKVRSLFQKHQMGFLRKINGLTLSSKVKSADIRESRNIDSLLYRPEKLQLRWYGCATRMSQKRRAKNCSILHRLVKGFEAVSELDGETTLKFLVNFALAFHQSTYYLLQRIDMLVGFNLNSCPRDPPRMSGSRKDR